ncbi:hypothetical protein D3C71_883370 [compost metagenome]
MLMFALVNVGAMVSTVALVVSARVVLPPPLVAVTLTLRLAVSMKPAVRVYVAVQMPALLMATMAEPPPNWLKSTVTALTPALLSPLALLFHVAVRVSPILYAPPVPVPPLMLMRASLIVGGAGAWQVTFAVNVPPPAPDHRYTE